MARRPPKRNAEIGTPAGSCHSGAIDGHCDAGTQKRELGCAAGVSDSGVHDCPFQSVRCAGASSVRFNGTLHDFMMLNALRDTESTRAAIALAVTALRRAFDAASAA